MPYSTTTVLFCSCEECIIFSAVYSCVKSAGSNLKISHRRQICDCRYTNNILCTFTVQACLWPIHEPNFVRLTYSLLFIPVKSKAKGNFRTAAIFLFHTVQKNFLSKCSLFKMYDNKSFHCLRVNRNRRVSLHKFSRPPCEKFLF